MITLYLLTTLTETLHVTLDAGKLLDVDFIRPNRLQGVGAIFHGRIEKKDDQLQAYFIDIGTDTFGYLDYKDALSTEHSPLTEGQYVMVQVTKAPYLSKGARLTQKIDLSDEALVYLPFEEKVNVSKKLSDETRDYLRTCLTPHIETGGVIVRTKAAESDPQMLIRKFHYFHAQFEQFKATQKQMKKPGMISSEATISVAKVQRLTFDQVETIIVDDVKLKRQIECMVPEIADRVKVKRQALRDISSQLTTYMNQLASPVVQLAEGVELVIEQTEAMTVIDINSSSYKTNASRKQAVININRLAVKAIARELQKRNISGMVVIDFIRMINKKDQQLVHDALKRAVISDPAPVTLYGFTRLGLFELTRKRTTESVMYTLFNQEIKSLERTQETHCYELERALIVMDTDSCLIAMNKDFLQQFKTLVNVARLKEKVMPDTYVIQRDIKTGYEIVRSGSHALINEFILNNPTETIDMLL